MCEVFFLLNELFYQLFIPPLLPHLKRIRAQILLLTIELFLLLMRRLRHIHLPDNLPKLLPLSVVFVMFMQLLLFQALVLCFFA